MKWSHFDLTKANNFSLSVKCIKSCSIGFSSYDLFAESETASKDQDIVVDNYASRKPLISVNLVDQKELAETGVKTLTSVVKRLGKSAHFGARVLGNTELAQNASAASTEAAR